jgi:hypothetical protein
MQTHHAPVIVLGGTGQDGRYVVQAVLIKDKPFDYLPATLEMEARPWDKQC